MAGVTKGSLVSHIIQHHSSRGGADFVLCLGDDSMDEDMFNVVRDYQHGAQYVKNNTAKDQQVTVCVVYLPLSLPCSLPPSLPSFPPTPPFLSRRP